MASVLLEDWLREFYFKVDYDLGSSGIEPYSFGDLCDIAAIPDSDLRAVTLGDNDTFGSFGLRAAIADRFGSNDPDMVMITHGSNEALFAVMRGLLEPGDECIVQSPGYEQFAGAAADSGAMVRRWKLPLDDSARPDLQSLDDLVTERTRIIVANFPHNPTGINLRPSEVTDIVEIARRVDAILVWDTAYEELVYESITAVRPHLSYENTLQLGTLSKAYGCPGLRIGWCLGRRDILDELVAVRDHTTLYASPLNEFIAEAIIRHGSIIISNHLSRARCNRDLVTEWAATLGKSIRWRPPEGGVCSFPAVPRVADVAAFCRELASRERVLVVPGDAFGVAGHIRLGFGSKRESVQSGLERLGSALVSVQT